MSLVEGRLIRDVLVIRADGAGPAGGTSEVHTGFTGDGLQMRYAYGDIISLRAECRDRTGREARLISTGIAW